MKEYFRKNRINFTLLLIIVFFTLGIFVGNNNKGYSAQNVFGKESVANAAQIDFTPFWKVWNSINEKYPLNKTTDQEKLYGAISGLVNSLNDPYTTFFKPEEAKIFESSVEGNFGGVGMEVGIKNGVLTVIAPLKDTPAYKANIQSGDKILKINDTVTTDLSIEEAIRLIRGDPGTVVRLTIFHEEDKQTKELKIIRDTIEIPTLDVEIRKDGIFVIKLYSFSKNSTKLFRNAMEKFVKSKSDKLLLDLRGNPGGYLEAAVDISSWFVEGGKIIVTEDYGKNKKPAIYRSKGHDLLPENIKFVILIDGGSASASEIVAGAMQDYGKALLVGEKSYGKGSIQEVVDITKDTLLKITVAKWLTPEGNSISEKGLTPDYKIPMTKKDLENKKDLQLNKAVELLNNWPK